MGRKSARRGVKGIPGRVRAEKERKEIEAKEHALRAVCATLHTLTATPASDAASTATAFQQLSTRETAIAAAFQELRQLALAPHGFISDAFRQHIWLFLVGCSGVEPLEKHDAAHFVTRCTGPHRDDSQVEKDIDRSLWCVSQVPICIYVRVLLLL